MKKTIYFLLVGIVSAITLVGCGVGKDSAGLSETTKEITSRTDGVDSVDVQLAINDEKDISNVSQENKDCECAEDEMPRLLMVNDVLYYDCAEESTVTGRCGMMDGTVEAMTDNENGIPTQNNTSNFGTGYGYQYGPNEGTIEVLIDNQWCVFRKYEKGSIGIVDKMEESVNSSEIIYEGRYVDDLNTGYERSEMIISKQDNGDYVISFGIYKLLYVSDAIGKYHSDTNELSFEGKDDMGNEVAATIHSEGEYLSVKLLKPTYDGFPTGSILKYYPEGYYPVEE